jgi:hypothetical protein
VSNLDPLARAAPAAQYTDPVAAEIASLTSDAEALRTMVSTGDIVAARVLPFNGLTDLVEILGRRVAAQLPPTVRPGETLILEVQGFDGDRIVVRNLGIEPQAQGQAPGQAAQSGRGGALPQAPAPLDSSSPEQMPYTSASGGVPPLPVGSQAVELPPQLGTASAGLGPAPHATAPAAAGAGEQTAPALTADDGQIESALSSPGGAEALAGGEPQIAPPVRPGIPLPRSVLIRASVETTDGPAEPPPAGSEEHPRVTFNVPSRAIETEKSLEARLIAARTSFARPGAPAARGTPAANQRGPAPPTAATQGRAAPAPTIPARDASVRNAPPATTAPAQRASAAPPPPPSATAQRPGGASWIETMTRTVMAKANLATPSAPAEEAAPAEPRSPAPELHSTTALATAPRLAESYREPTVLLRALRLPVTPSNVAAAKLALESPQRLPHALATLERALPLGNADPRVNTLRTLAAFVGNPDPRSEAFPAQISAYVSHVLEGPEPKLTTLLQLFGRTTAPPEDAEGEPAPATQTAQDAEADANAAPGTSSAQSGAPAAAHQQSAAGPASQPPAPAQADTATQARVAERATAMEYDLKTVLQSFISQPPPGAAPASLAAAHAALAAVTAAQLGVATAQTDPRVLALEIPLPFTANGSPAKIMVSRDKPDGEGPITADNFHIAFVLDTKNVGTVAIDLMTVGREVSVSVKSETPRYAAAFGSKLEELGKRLGQLRYNVSSMESGIVSRAGATTTIAGPAPPPQERDDDSSAWDLRV